MMSRTIHLAVFCFAISPLICAANLRYVTIDFPHATDTVAVGINARGDIVGRYNDAGGVAHGFLLHHGVFSTIDFPNGTFTAAGAINARGDIVGRTQDQSGVDHGYLLSNGRFTRIDFPGSVATIARGINNAGDISGNYTDTAGNEVGFILQNGKFYSLRAPNSCSTDVWLLQDNGLVGVGDTCSNPDGQLHGFLRTSPGVYQLFDFPTGGAFACTAPRWINERRDIVGLYLVANSSDDCYNGSISHGFLLRNGTFSAINFPGAISSDVFAINDDGVIVGDYTDKAGQEHGFEAVPVQ